MSDSKKTDLTRLEDLDPFQHDDADENSADALPDQDQTGAFDLELDESSPQEDSSSDEVLEFDVDDLDIESGPEDGEQDDFTSQFGGDFTDGDAFEGAEQESPYDEEASQIVENIFSQQLPEHEIDEENLHEEEEKKEPETDFNQGAEEEIEQEHEERETLEFSGPSTDDSIEQPAIKSDEVDHDDEKHRVVDESPRPDPSISERNLDDVKEQAEAIQYAPAGGETYPSFSLIIEGIRSQELQEELLRLLKEILPERGETSRAAWRNQIEKGKLLVSRTNETALVYLYHKLKSWPVSLRMGKTHEIVQGEADEGPTVELSSLAYRQNQSITHHFDYPSSVAEEFTTTTMERPPGREIFQFLGVVTQSKLVDVYDLDQQLRSKAIEDSEQDTMLPEQKAQQRSSVAKNYSHQHFEELIQLCQHKAKNLRANALVGVSFQTMPMKSNSAHFGPAQYFLICTGSAVVLQRQEPGASPFNDSVKS